MIATPLILAIDLGKFNSVFCWFDPATKATTFRTVPSNPETIRDALLRQPGVTAVMEACSPAGWVTDLCQSLGVPFVVASTNGAAWAWKNVKRKRASPIRSAECGMLNQDWLAVFTPHSAFHTPHFFQEPAERRGFWGVARSRSDSRLSLSWQPADPVELFGTASVFWDRLMEADERTIPALLSDHRVGRR